MEHCPNSTPRSTSLTWILFRGIAAGVLGIGVAHAPAAAQATTATVTVEENFRAEPNGGLLGRISPGTVLGVESTEGSWVEVTLEGWVWTPSLTRTERSDFEWVVSVEEGENLRVEPQGTVLARLVDGTLLEEVDEGDGWIRVRRTAWIWEPSVELDESVVAVDDPAEGAPEVSVADVEAGLADSGAEGLAVLAAPDGDTLARTLPGTELRVLGRQGSWARVQLEGWAWIPEGTPASAGGDVIADATPDDVAGDPDAYRGRTVAWTLRFISLERAESVRTDFYEGEPYLLTRADEGSSRFVYVAVPPERVESVEALNPLERILVVGRIRTGSAALTGGPILDLMELTRQSGAGGGR